MRAESFVTNTEHFVGCVFKSRIVLSLPVFLQAQYVQPGIFLPKVWSSSSVNCFSQQHHLYPVVMPESETSSFRSPPTSAYQLLPIRLPNTYLCSVSTSLPVCCTLPPLSPGHGLPPASLRSLLPVVLGHKHLCLCVDLRPPRVHHSDTLPHTVALFYIVSLGRTLRLIVTGVTHCISASLHVNM